MATLSKTKTTYLRTRAFSDVCKGAGTEDEVKRTCSEAFAALGILDVSLKIVTKPVAKQFEVTAQVDIGAQSPLSKLIELADRASKLKVELEAARGAYAEATGANLRTTKELEKFEEKITKLDERLAIVTPLAEFARAIAERAVHMRVRDYYIRFTMEEWPRPRKILSLTADEEARAFWNEYVDFRGTAEKDFMMLRHGFTDEVMEDLRWQGQGECILSKGTHLAHRITEQLLDFIGLMTEDKAHQYEKLHKLAVTAQEYVDTRKKRV